LELIREANCTVPIGVNRGLVSDLSNTLGTMPEEPVTRLVLVRHGESRATVDRIVAGHDTCKGLTDRGRQQAEALRDRLARPGELAATTRLVASLMERARETAEIIA